jgi:PadR family transcriptional regulator PadR
MTRRHLGEFEQLLLLAVTQLQDEEAGACGPTIGRLVLDRTGRTISPGAIYTALDRLDRRGFVRSELGDPTPERGGKRKRFYRMRPAGAAALRATQSAVAAIARGLLQQRPRPALRQKS